MFPHIKGDICVGDKKNQIKFFSCNKNVITFSLKLKDDERADRIHNTYNIMSESQILVLTKHQRLTNTLKN